MNPGQEQFFNFILDRVSEENKAAASSLLQENFARQALGTFDADYAAESNPKLVALLKPEHRDEVLAIMKQFGSDHVSK